MPQSLSQVIIHIVFSTKGREPWLDSVIRPRMHAYLATVCRDCQSEAYRVGAVRVGLTVRFARDYEARLQRFDSLRPMNPGRCPGLV